MSRSEKPNRCRLDGAASVEFRALALVSLVLLIPITFLGCSHAVVKRDELKKHVLLVDADGYVRSVNELLKASSQQLKVHDLRQMKEEEFKLAKDNFQPLSKAIGEHIETNQHAKLLIFVHGGLNSRATSLERANALYPKIMNAGYYPIFINWRSSLKDTYEDHLFQITQGQKSNSRKYLSPFIALNDVLRAVGGALGNWIVQGKHAVDSMTKKEHKNIGDYEVGYDYIRVVPPGREYHCGSDRPSAKRRKLQWLVTSPAKVLTTPFVAELGRPAWDIMRRRTQTLFWTSRELRHNAAIHDRQSKGKGGVSRLLEFLEQDGHQGIEIVLIGHSMGAFVANRIVERAPSLNFTHIVHMASADSIANTYELTFKYMRDHSNTHFYNLMLHPRNENRELTAAGLSPSGSLLVWIDNMYTAPSTILDRRAGRWQNVRKVLHLIDPSLLGDKRVHLTIFDRESRKHPLQHGDFGRCEFWKASFWKGE